MLPYSFNTREGHVSQSEADNRAYAAAEKKIKDDYAKIFDNYISQLIPEK